MGRRRGTQVTYGTQNPALRAGPRSSRAHHTPWLVKGCKGSKYPLSMTLTLVTRVASEPDTWTLTVTVRAPSGYLRVLVTDFLAPDEHSTT